MSNPDNGAVKDDGHPHFERQEMRGLWDQLLTPEQKKAALAYRGPESHGVANALKQRP